MKMMKLLTNRRCQPAIQILGIGGDTCRIHQITGHKDVDDGAATNESQLRTRKRAGGRGCQRMFPKPSNFVNLIARETRRLGNLKFRNFVCLVERDFIAVQCDDGVSCGVFPMHDALRCSVECFRSWELFVRFWYAGCYLASRQAFRDRCGSGKDSSEIDLIKG